MRTPTKPRRVALVAAVGMSILVAAPSSAYVRPGATDQVDYINGRVAPEGASYYSSISDNGRYVAFDSDAALLSHDTNGKSDVYVTDLKTDRLWLASATSTGALGILPFVPTLPSNPLGDITCPAEKMSRWDHHWSGRTDMPLSWDPAISGNGRYVAFSSWGALVPGDTNLVADVFVFDRLKEAVEIVSVNSDEAPGATQDGSYPGCPMSWSPSIDRTGRRVAFTSAASNMTENDVNRSIDAFVRDLQADTTQRVSEPLGEDSNECLVERGAVPGSSAPLFCPVSVTIHSEISGNSRFVAFQSLADNLVRDDTNDRPDIFVRDLKKKTTERVSVDSAEQQIGDNSLVPYECPTSSTCTDNSVARKYSTTLGDERGLPKQSISADGRFVIFHTTATDVVPVGGAGIFVRDRVRGRTVRVNALSTGEVASGLAAEVAPTLSGDGRIAVFKAPGSSVPFGFGLNNPLVTYDLRTGALELLSRSSTGEKGTGCHSWDGDLNFNGRYATLSSCSPKLLDVPDPVERWHVLLRDRGLARGTGGFPGHGVEDPAPADDRICILETCIPPGAAISEHDLTSEARLSSDDADLIEAIIAYRPELEDLFIVAEVEYLWGLRTLSTTSPYLYGLRFDARGHHYEVRASAQLGGTFGLFDCTASHVGCTKVTDLRGGYGTTGERIVFSIPLAEIGLEHGGELSDVEVFSALGTSFTGVLSILDRIPVQ